MPVPHCGTPVCLFCRNRFGFRLIFGQAGRRRRIDATLSPSSRHKYQPPASTPAMKRLPESS
jgi:hypothetical protein